MQVGSASKSEVQILQPITPWLRNAVRATPTEEEAITRELPDWQQQLLALLVPVIHQARLEGRQSIGDVNALAVLAAELWLAKPPISLVRLVTAAFVIDMNAAKSMHEGAIPIDNWFKHHLRFLSLPEALEGFYRRYPLLASLIEATITGWRDAGVEFAERIASDIVTIESLVGAGRLTLIDVQPGFGDSHSRGRTVARVIFDGGQVAYKPRPAGAAVGLRNLLSQLTLNSVITLEFGVPKLVDCGDYAWMAWIDSTPCDTPEELARYYRRLGQLSGLAWLLGSSDLHSENIVAKGDTPYIVDVETLLSPVLKSQPEAHNHPAPGLLMESPISTGLLPFSITVADGLKADFSAIGDGIDQVGGEVTTWDFTGTSAMVAVRRPIPRDAPKSMPIIAQGRQQGALEFEAEINCGFQETLRAFSADALRTVFRVVQDHTLWPLRFCRFVLRNTSDYAQVTELLWHPAVLHDPRLVEDGARALREAPIDADSGVVELIVSKEIEELKLGDVPYFQTNVTDRHLYDSKHQVVVAEYFEASPLDRVAQRAKILARGAAPINWVTAASIRGAKLNRRMMEGGDGCCAVLPLSSLSTPQLLLDGANAVAERICDLECNDGDDVSWLTLRVDRDSQWQVSPMDRSLYLGTAGVLLFLQTLSSVTTLNPRIEALRIRLLTQWERTDIDAVPALGAFDGVAGDLYLAHRLGETPRLGERRSALINRLRDTGEHLDLLSGAAGIVLVLSRLAARRPNMRELLFRTAEPHVDQLLESFEPTGDGGVWSTGEEGQALVGFAHGVAGINFGLMQFITTFPESRLVDPVKAVLSAAYNWHTSVFDADAENWPDFRVLPEGRSGFSQSWCHGSAGIGIAYAGAAGIQGIWGTTRLKRDVEFAVGTSLRHGLGTGQALCHGDLGVAEVLLTAGLACQRPDWLQQVRLVASMVAKDVLDNRGVTTEEFGLGVDIPGFMVGAAGIGYELLRVAHPTFIPSVLSLEG